MSHGFYNISFFFSPSPTPQQPRSHSPSSFAQPRTTPTANCAQPLRPAPAPTAHSRLALTAHSPILPTSVAPVPRSHSHNAQVILAKLKIIFLEGRK
ncbi:hypothetical protein ACOSQ2_016636 [Xanthoceras sorbifolium]